MEFKNIIYEKSDAVVTITINRPDKRNALNIETRRELKEALSLIRSDGDVKLAVITGAGDAAFIAGADLNDLKDMAPLEAEKYLNQYGQRLYTEIEELEVPVIAMINGFCLGGGCELAMACDIRIAAENAKFGQPEIVVGIIPGGGATQRLPRLVGYGKAKELIFTGDIIDAREAERIGLVDKVVPQGELKKTVDELVRKLLGRSQVSLRAAKKAINRSMRSGLDEGLAYEAQTFCVLFSSEDSKEGIAAFLEKRKPSFKGK